MKIDSRGHNSHNPEVVGLNLNILFDMDYAISSNDHYLRENQCKIRKLQINFYIGQYVRCFIIWLYA
jgi:hypothetical protein